MASVPAPNTDPRPDTFSAAVDAASERGEVRRARRELRAFLVGPVDLDLIDWISGHEDLTAHGRIISEGDEFVSVTVSL